MNKIDNLIETGESFRLSGINKGNFEDFSQWIAECSLFLETKYKSLEFTKEFIKNSSTIVDIYFSTEMFLEEQFKYVMGSLNGAKEHEESYNASLNNFMENAK